MVALCAAYALADGILAIAAAARAGYANERWAGSLAEGLTGISAVFVMAIWAEVTLAWLLWIVAAWGTVTGISAIITTTHLQEHVTREWLLASAGIVSMRFGLLVTAAASSGALAVALWAGGNAFAMSILFLTLEARLRTGAKSHRPTRLVQLHAR